MKPILWSLIGGVKVLGGLGAVGVASSTEIKVEEQVVGPAKAGGVYAVSPRGAHVAYAGKGNPRRRHS